MQGEATKCKELSGEMTMSQVGGVKKEVRTGTRIDQRNSGQTCYTWLLNPHHLEACVSHARAARIKTGFRASII